MHNHIPSTKTKTLREIMMKNFTIAFMTLATIGFVSSSTFAATPYYNSNHYNSRYDSNLSHRSWNADYSYRNRDYLNYHRTYNDFDYLPNRSNSRLRRYQCDTMPSSYLPHYRTNFRSYPYSNRLDYRYNSRYNNYQRDYDRSYYDWRVGR